VYTNMQQWAEIRRRVLSGELSKRAACREYEIHWETLRKILTHVEPPGYRRTKPKQSIIDPFLVLLPPARFVSALLDAFSCVHQILKHDQRV